MTQGKGLVANSSILASQMIESFEDVLGPVHTHLPLSSPMPWDLDPDERDIVMAFRCLLEFDCNFS